LALSKFVGDACTRATCGRAEEKTDTEGNILWQTGYLRCMIEIKYLACEISPKIIILGFRYSEDRLQGFRELGPIIAVPRYGGRSLT